MSRRRHELVIFEDGSASLRELSSGQTMHSSIGAWRESNLLYVDQSRLAQRLRAPHGLAPLVIFDIGLGIAANAIAAIECRAKLAREAPPGEPVRGLEIISFENDPDGLAHALEKLDSFPFLLHHEEDLKKLLLYREIRKEGVHWKLVTGDFRSSIRHLPLPAPDLIFYDFYAPAICPELWTPDVLRSLPTNESTLLCTYSASTRVRLGLLLAGFCVGYGMSTALKSGSTLAAKKLSQLERPLGAEWIRKLRRSATPVPFGWDLSRKREVFSALGQLEMFRGIAPEEFIA